MPDALPKYLDSEGRECSLPVMCLREPEWAASRLAVTLAENETLQGQLSMLQAVRVAEEEEMDRLRRDAALGKAVRRAIEDAAADDGTPPLQTACRLRDLHGDEELDPDGDVWAVLDAIVTALRSETP